MEIFYVQLGGSDRGHDIKRLPKLSQAFSQRQYTIWKGVPIEVVGTSTSIFCFCTYGLSGINPGGAGVLISALILSHLKAGHKVVVIADVAPFELERWRTLMVPRTLEPRLTTFARSNKF